jgi:glycerophosphoryl diester phosphodiesterase
MPRKLGSIITAILATVLLTGLSALLSGQSARASTASPPGAGAPGRSVTVTNVAHRGASHDAPENTMVAFELAKTMHADMFEIDVQETRDDKLVLMHDTTLARTTNVEEVFPDRSPWNVRDFSLAEIRKLDAGSWFAPEFAGEPVPTLDETLEEMEDAGMGLLLEVKSPSLYPGIGANIADEVLEHPSWSRPDPNGRRLILQSFDWDFVKEFAPLLPRVPRGLLGTPPVAELPELATFANQINPTHGDLTADYVARVHELDMEVFTWTVDDPAGMRRAIDLGVDGVITNRPDVLHEVIGANGGAAANLGTGGGAHGASAG